jgi:Zn-dependent protease
MSSEFLVAGIVWYVVFLLSTTCHEAAHAWAARIGGDPTAFHGGQVSLDPLPHIRREPFGMVIFPILSYVMGGWMMGWASAPYDPYWAQQHPRRAAWMSLAGPGANFALALLAGVLIRAGILAGALHFPDSVSFTQIVEPAGAGVSGGLATFLSILFSLNLLLGVFNLLPIPPMDGFSVVGIFLPEDAGRRYQEFGWSIRQYAFLGLLVAWQLFDPIFQPIFHMSLRMLYI